MEYKHFSHEHPLTLYTVQPNQNFQCHGCTLPCRDSIFVCWTCNFFLHEHCGNANRYVKHPSHPQHPLVLTPTPTYCSGSFICNACGSQGSAFSYCCPLCEIDLHVHCAYLPEKVKHNSHPHEIHLALGRDDKETLETCKVCAKKLDFSYWYYFCDKVECGFRVHTYCATSEVKLGLGMYQDDVPDEKKEEVKVPEEDLAAMMLRFQLQLQMQNQMSQMTNNMINSARPR